VALQRSAYIIVYQSCFNWYHIARPIKSYAGDMRTKNTGSKTGADFRIRNRFSTSFLRSCRKLWCAERRCAVNKRGWPSLGQSFRPGFFYCSCTVASKWK